MSAYKYEQCEKGLLLWIVVFDVPVKGLKIDKTPLPLTILHAYIFIYMCLSTVHGIQRPEGNWLK